MNRNDSLDRAVRLLDPADRSVDAGAGAGRAQSMLHAILAVEPAPPTRRQPVTVTAGNVAQRGRVFRGRRLALLGGVATVVAAALVVVPALTGGDKAFATWTATPTGMSAQQREDAAESCRAQMSDGGGDDDATSLANASVAIAESRGVWTTVLLAGDDGLTALCITDQSGPLFSDRMIGSVGFADLAAPGPRAVVGTDLGVGTIGSDISVIAGRAGTEVLGVTYASRAHGTVAATVSDGHFALWFPGDELVTASAGVDVEVTFTDGTSRTVRLSL